MTPGHIAEIVKAFFADRKRIRVDEFNELLLDIIGKSSLDFCRSRVGEGATREQINAELPAYLDAWTQWQTETLQRFRAFVREVNGADEVPTQATRH